jgi:hypothetical protein
LQTHTNKLKPNKRRKIGSLRKILIQIICVSSNYSQKTLSRIGERKRESPFIPSASTSAINIRKFSTGGVCIYFLYSFLFRMVMMMSVRVKWIFYLRYIVSEWEKFFCDFQLTSINLWCFKRNVEDLRKRFGSLMWRENSWGKNFCA